MTAFRYEGINELGRTEIGEIAASDDAQAYQALVAMGITATQLQPDGAGNVAVPWYKRDISLRRSAVPLLEQADTAAQLAVLLRSKLPVVEILTILARGAPNFRARQRFERVVSMVADGTGLSEAFERMNTDVSPLFGSVLRLVDVLPDPADTVQSLANFLRRQDRSRRQIAGALIYPAILVVTAFVVLLIVSLLLAPNLAPMFRAMDRPVPTAIAIFDWVGKGLSEHGVFFVVAAMTALLGSAAALTSSWGRQHLRLATARLPIVGATIRTAELAQITQGLAMLVRSRLPLSVAFRQSSLAFRENLFANLFERCASSLDEGGLASSIFDTDPHIPPAFLELYRVGEATNTLQDTLPVMATELDSRAEQRMSNLLALMTPILTLIIGGAVALLVYSVMTAIFSVNDLAG